ncbi:helix-turn-helix domain-containing protein [Streptomyces sp. NPDC056638]|uniref:helix-turn-helix domain-containing protein n=1 Tax=Streptomyces sp. NPDC056638 TaxID=3345887 RepID=UPI0036A190D9
MALRTDGAEIRRRRELTGMTLVEFAKATGYTLNYASQIELGNVNAGPRFHRAAASQLGCDIADITDGPIPWGAGKALAASRKSAA